MRVFLTGATGFIGSRVAPVLRDRGHELCCLVRPTSDTAALARLDAELIQGDVTDPAALSRGFEGADAAIHLAGIYDVGVVDEREMERVNVGGTVAFLAAVAASNVQRAVHVSSTAALGPAPDGVGRAEAEWQGPYPSAYHRTKTEAHRLARRAQANGMPLVVVCPAFVYGPGDAGPAGRFISDLLHGRVPGLLTRPSIYSYVFVDDVAAGMAAACERGSPGAVYVLSGEAASINDFAIRIAGLAGRRPPPLRMPVWLASGLGTALDAVSRVTGLRFTVNRESVATSADLRWVHDDQRSVQELDWKPRPLSEGLPPTIDYFS